MDIDYQYALSAETWRISDLSRRDASVSSYIAGTVARINIEKCRWYMVPSCLRLCQNPSKLPMIYDSCADFSEVLHIATTFDEPVRNFGKI